MPGNLENSENACVSALPFLWEFSADLRGYRDMADGNL